MTDLDEVKLGAADEGRMVPLRALLKERDRRHFLEHRLYELEREQASRGGLRK